MNPRWFLKWTCWKIIFSSKRTTWTNENEWMNPRWVLEWTCWKSFFSSERTRWINENEWMNPRWFLKWDCWKTHFSVPSAQNESMNDVLSNQIIELFMFSPQSTSRCESWFDLPRVQQLVQYLQTPVYCYLPSSKMCETNLCNESTHSLQTFVLWCVPSANIAIHFSSPIPPNLLSIEDGQYQYC